MAKQISETKKEILKLLSCKTLRNSDIAEKIGLKESTIFEHLQELLTLGMIRRVYLSYPAKSTYYETIR